MGSDDGKARIGGGECYSGMVLVQRPSCLDPDYNLAAHHMRQLWTELKVPGLDPGNSDKNIPLTTVEIGQQSTLQIHRTAVYHSVISKLLSALLGMTDLIETHQIKKASVQGI